MKIALFACLLLLASPAHAVEGAFIYSKTIIRIAPKSEVAPAPQEDAKPNSDGGIIMKDTLLPALKRVPKEFTVEVRDPSFLRQTDFIAHQPFTDREGMMILIDPPAEAEVRATRMIASADVLFVNEDGVIIKIAPSLKLRGLSEPVPSGRPVHAFIYLKAGTTAADDIQVGDHIENVSFKTHPVVIQ